MEKCLYLLRTRKLFSQLTVPSKRNFLEKEKNGTNIECEGSRDRETERQQIAANNAGVHGGKHTVALNTIT